jgi:hypothetical protein
MTGRTGLHTISNVCTLLRDLNHFTFNYLLEDACIGHFNTIAQSTNTPVCLVSSQILAQHLVDVVKLEHNESTSQTCCHLLPEEVKVPDSLGTFYIYITLACLKEVLFYSNKSVFY